MTFAYDSDGKRVKKTSGNTETKYYYNGSTLSGLVRTTTGNTGTTKTTVQFVYDAEGKPFLLRLNGKTTISICIMVLEMLWDWLTAAIR